MNKTESFIEEINSYIFDTYVYGMKKFFVVKEIDFGSEDHEQNGILVVNTLNSDKMKVGINPDTKTMEVKFGGDWGEILDAGDFWKFFYLINRKKQ